MDPDPVLLYYEDIGREIVGKFLSIFFEALPFIVLGSVIAGFLEELVPQRFVERFIPRNRTVAIALSALLGLIFPMCECGIVPVMRRLLRKGLPLSCCVAYMLAGPIINAVVLLSTVAAFGTREGGWWIVGLRAGIGFLVAFGTAHVVEFLWRKHGNDLLQPQARPSESGPEGDGATGPSARRTLWQRVGAIAETSLHDFVDITLFLILGALMAAVVGVLIHRQDIAELASAHPYLYPVVSILAMMVLAVVLCLCSEADAFVAAVFTSLHPAAKVAFLVLGPMLDFKLMFLYTRVFRFRLIRAIIISVVVQVFLYCLLLYWLSVLVPQLGLKPETGP